MQICGSLSFPAGRIGNSWHSSSPICTKPSAS
nr:MAG TPA: hypothetical protein [Caudoviricetes sp.]